MKKPLKIFFISFMLIFILLLVDIFACRSYFSGSISYDSYFYKKITEKNINTTYSAKKTGTDSLKLHFRNNSITPLYFVNYRHDKSRMESIFPDLDNSRFFSYASRTILKFPFKKQEPNIGFDCGTGLGVTSIKPFESFDHTINLSDITEHMGFLNNFVHLTDSSVLLDLKYLKPIGRLNELENGNINIEWLENSKLDSTDSIDIQLFLPVYRITSDDLAIAYSNEIKLSYWNILRKKSEEFINKWNSWNEDQISRRNK